VLIAGATSKLWIRVRNPEIGGAPALSIGYHWRAGSIDPASSVNVVLTAFEDGSDFEVALTAPENGGIYDLELYVNDDTRARSVGSPLIISVTVIPKGAVASHLLNHTRPLSYAWGVDRGVAVHRMHLEQFLATHSADIKGRCLEFQEPRYVPRFGGSFVQTLDILHADSTNPNATLVADLTQPNSLRDSQFDCVVCTHVLQSIFALEKAIAELYRILAPDGVLLIAVPQVSMCDSRYGELWRFTPAGLFRLVTTAFKPADVTIAAFGNSLTSAGELRGLVASEFSVETLSQHDSRFAAEICARAVKR